jgi:NAD(P)-dependent dehydrogenase (short-subunit alcohol dehydrogenase family)
MMNCVRAEVNAMARDGTGSIVNCSSVCGRSGFRKLGAYVTSKHAVIGMTRSAAKDLAEWNIRVNAIAPGSIDTDFNTNVAKVKERNEMEAVTSEQRKLLEGWEDGSSLGMNKMWIDRMGAPEEIAGLVEYLLGDKSTYSTGAVYAADGGMIC